MGRKYSQEEVLQWVEAYKKVGSSHSVAKAFGVKPMAVMYQLRKRLGSRGPRNKHTAEEVLRWAEAYRQTRSVVKVARLFGIHKATVIYRLREVLGGLEGPRKHSLESLQRAAIGRGGSCLSSAFYGVSGRYQFRCKDGHVWESRGNTMLAGSWCRACLASDIEELRDKASANGGELLSTEYQSANKKYRWKCKEGHVWEATWGQVNSGSWCSRCCISKPQQALEALVKDILGPGIDVVSCDRQAIKPMELDIWIPALQKALEYDGSYWHDSPEAQERDRRKDLRCQKKGISLLRVPEDRWLRDRQALESELREFLRPCFLAALGVI